MGLVFFKINKHKRFNYKPVFYDEQKEALEEMKKNATTTQEADLERLRLKLKDRWQRQRTAKSKSKGFLITGFIIFLLFVVVYFLLK